MDQSTDDPGSAQYGNFINYYTFNTAEDRLELLPTHIWKDKSKKFDDYFLVLDIGCNAGNFTQLLLPFLTKHTQKNVIILGVDIDQLLINRCNEHNQYPENVSYACMDIMDKTENIFQGHLDMYGKVQFDAVFCLSLTMWIHLNHGDSGLRQFLDKIHRLASLLVIEPQPWKCYLTAVKRQKKANKVFEEFTRLTLRNTIENDIHQYLERQCELHKIFETIPTKWNRKICFYKPKVLDYSVRLF